MMKWLLHPKYIAAIEKYMSFKRGRRRPHTRLEEIEILRLQRLESLMPKQPSLYHLWQPAIRHFSVSSPISSCPKPEIAEHDQEHHFGRIWSRASFWQNMIKSIILTEYDQEHHFGTIWSRVSFWQDMIVIFNFAIIPLITLTARSFHPYVWEYFSARSGFAGPCLRTPRCSRCSCLDWGRDNEIWMMMMVMIMIIVD